jgi:phosphosulfolactate phosphohydrolase-like enzyme
MREAREVSIDTFPESAFRHLECDALVCIDVVEATTAMVTGALQGRPVLPVNTLGEALALKSQLVPTPLLSFTHEPGGTARTLPIGLAALARLDDKARPLIVAGSSGARLVLNACAAPAVYVACFRNLTATAAALASAHDNVVIVAAGELGESRCEDEMAAVRIACSLLERGFRVTDHSTQDLIGRWGAADLTLARYGKSVEDLRRSGRQEDVEFLLAHVDDVAFPCRYTGGEPDRLRGVIAARSTTAPPAVARQRSEVSP